MNIVTMSAEDIREMASGLMLVADAKDKEQDALKRWEASTVYLTNMAAEWHANYGNAVDLDPIEVAEADLLPEHFGETSQAVALPPVAEETDFERFHREGIANRERQDVLLHASFDQAKAEGKTNAEAMAIATKAIGQDEDIEDDDEQTVVPVVLTPAERWSESKEDVKTAIDNGLSYLASLTFPAEPETYEQAMKEYETIGANLKEIAALEALFDEYQDSPEKERARAYHFEWRATREDMERKVNALNPEYLSWLASIQPVKEQNNQKLMALRMVIHRPLFPSSIGNFFGDENVTYSVKQALWEKVGVRSAAKTSHFWSVSKKDGIIHTVFWRHPTAENANIWLVFHPELGRFTVSFGGKGFQDIIELAVNGGEWLNSLGEARTWDQGVQWLKDQGLDDLVWEQKKSFSDDHGYHFLRVGYNLTKDQVEVEVTHRDKTTYKDTSLIDRQDWTGDRDELMGKIVDAPELKDLIYVAQEIAIPTMASELHDLLSTLTREFLKDTAKYQVTQPS